MTLGEKINAANAEALNRILSAQPTLIGVGTAGEDIPGMTKKTILHSRGEPLTRWSFILGYEEKEDYSFRGGKPTDCPSKRIPSTTTLSCRVVFGCSRIQIRRFAASFPIWSVSC